MKSRKIAIDIDGVIAQFSFCFLDYLGLPLEAPTEWKDKRFVDNFHKIESDEKFWLTIKPLVSPGALDFEIDSYVTARPVSSEVTSLWLRANGFPSAPVITVGLGKSKVKALKERGVEVFLDDAVHNYEEINESGILCYLMDASHNQGYETPLRVNSLSEFKSIINKRIVLSGPAASGKDYFRDYLTSKEYVPDISYTTRPPRKGEVDGVTYHFVTEEEFAKVVKKESVDFNGWKYCTSLDSWENSDVFIMTPTGISQLTKEDRKECCIVYFNIPLEVRRERLELRSDVDTVDRRITADEKDFKDFNTYDHIVYNNKFDCETITKQIDK